MPGAISATGAGRCGDTQEGEEENLLGGMQGDPARGQVTSNRLALQRSTHITGWRWGMVRSQQAGYSGSRQFYSSWQELSASGTFE